MKKETLPSGMQLKLARVKAGLSQKQLAIYFGAHPNKFTIGNLELGTYEPSAKNLRLYNTFLHTPVETVKLRARTLGIKVKETRGRFKKGEGADP